MKNNHSIMVATDMSECATMAESRAAMLCQQLGKSRLDIVNVQDLSIINMLTRVLKSSSSDTEDAVRESAVQRRFGPGSDPS